MTYIEIKTINGRQYKYLRKTIKIGERVVHTNVQYLGPVNPAYKYNKNPRKTNASIYIRELSTSEYNELKKLTKSKYGFTRDRARILLLSSEHLISKQVAEKVSCGVRKIRNAIKAFNGKGMKALERGKARGSLPKFTVEQRAKMLKIASTEPHKLGLHFTTWSLSKLRNYYIKESIVESISQESVRRLLKEEGMKIKKSKRFQYSNDIDFDKKNL